ncbi:MAG: AAA family ATPase [Aureliella sp.]
MAQSLNQAFIQAFKKSGPEPQPAEAKDASAGNDFLVRIDTATLAVPEPHFLKRTQKPRPSQPTVDETSDLPSPRATSPATPAVVTTKAVGESNVQNTTVRESIAAQMQQASDPKNGMNFESFFGSEIVTSAGTTQAPPKPSPSSNRAAEVDQAESDLANSIEPTIAPAPTVEASQGKIAQAEYWEQAMSEESHPDSIVTQAEDLAVRTPRTSASRPAVFEPQVPAETPTKLDAPSSPALSPDEVEKIVENYVKKHGNGGEIFRLDRPTYGSPESDHAVEEPSGDSVSFEEQESWTQIDAPEIAEPKQSVRAPEVQKQIEENLRQAKARSFNAVWEVDRLQWPAVCEELMASCESSLSQVAINLGKASHEGLQVLAVTSPQAGDGRTTVACCLAKVAATAGLRVAIVDGDIENPTLCYQTNLDLEDDWKAAIFRQLPLEEVAVHSLEDQLTVIPLLEPIEDYEIDSDDNRIAFMLQQLSESFDLVIVDMGHMDSKRSLVMPMTDQGIVNAILAVVDHRQTTPQRVEACLRRIRRTGIASIGIVENFAG